MELFMRTRLAAVMHRGLWGDGGAHRRALLKHGGKRRQSAWKNTGALWMKALV